MTPLLKKTAAQLGYDDPTLLFRITAWTSATFALATIVGKFFVPDLNLKSHFVFGQVTSLTFNLIFYNDHIARKLEPREEEPINPMKIDVFYVIHYVAFSVLPFSVGKLIVSRCFENVTWLQAAKRELYFGGFSITTLCATELYKRGQKKQGF